MEGLFYRGCHLERASPTPSMNGTILRLSYTQNKKYNEISIRIAQGMTAGRVKRN